MKTSTGAALQDGVQLESVRLRIEVGRADDRIGIIGRGYIAKEDKQVSLMFYGDAQIGALDASLPRAVDMRKSFRIVVTRYLAHTQRTSRHIILSIAHPHQLYPDWAGARDRLENKGISVALKIAAPTNF